MWVKTVNLKFGIFSNWRNHHWSAQRNMHGLLTIILHRYHLFLVFLLSCCNHFLQFVVVVVYNWSWNQAKSASYCPLFAHSSHDERWRLFLRQLQRLVKLCTADQFMKSHTNNSWLDYQKKRRRKNQSRTSCWKMQPVLIFCGWPGALAFHLCSR